MLDTVAGRRSAASDTVSDEAALVALLAALDARGYAFVCPTPETARRIVRRPEKRRATTLRDVFGWSRPFDEAVLDAELFRLAGDAGAIRRTRHGWRACVRVSTLDGRLFLHSAYPTLGERAVFFGPDTYRFAAWIAAEAEGLRPDRVVDVGGGCGGGAITLAARLGVPAMIGDVNPDALRLARANAAHAGVRLTTMEGSGVAPLGDRLQLVIANPPYVAGSGDRAYRYGGGLHGGELSLAWALEAAGRLAPDGRMLLYTGAAVVDGRLELARRLETELPSRGCRLRWRELDPDVFGELLSTPPYRNVERIAAIGLVIDRA
jgi:hypothetical protein